MGPKEVIRSQYVASLEMLGDAISACPEGLWIDLAYPNRFWHVAYHALFFAHLYLQESEKTFVAWGKHRKDHQFLGRMPWPPHEQPVIGEPYTKEEVLEYLEFCRREVDARLPLTDLDAESGFHWLPFNKLGVQIYNIRHIQHHVGQLADRLRTRDGVGVQWVR